MRSAIQGFWALPMVLVLAACGDSVSGVQSLPNTIFPANRAFSLEVVIRSCSNSCATYEAPDCDVDVDEDERSIEVDASVCFDVDDENCTEQCGAPIVAVCQVEALAPGEYEVTSENFRGGITLR